MSGFKTEFYEKMKKDISNYMVDYKVPGANSELPFLCSYLRQKRENALSLSKGDLQNGGRSDKYIILRRKQLQYQSGEINAVEFFESILSAVTETRFSIDRDIYAKCCNVYLEVIAQCPSLEDVPDKYAEKPKKYKQKLHNVIDGLQSVRNADIHIDDEKLNELSEVVKIKILLQLANEKIYDATATKSFGSTAPRKNDDTMDMIDSFFSRTEASYSLSASVTDGEFSEKDFDEIEQLFSELNKDESRTSVIFPLVTDFYTGVGLFIMGKEYLNVKDQGKQSVVYAVVYLSYKEGCPYEYDYDDSILCHHNYVSFNNNIKEAYEGYKESLQEHDIAYTTYNQTPPAGCPPKYRDFFEEYSKLDSEAESYKKAEDDKIRKAKEKAKKNRA